MADRKKNNKQSAERNRAARQAMMQAARGRGITTAGLLPHQSETA